MFWIKSGYQVFISPQKYSVIEFQYAMRPRNGQEREQGSRSVPVFTVKSCFPDSATGPCWWQPLRHVHRKADVVAV